MAFSFRDFLNSTAKPRSFHARKSYRKIKCSMLFFC